MYCLPFFLLRYGALSRQKFQCDVFTLFASFYDENISLKIEKNYDNILYVVIGYYSYSDA